MILKKRKCPKCREMTGVPIEYGLPGLELWEAAERGEVVLGGCEVSFDDPTHQCSACGHRWDSQRKAIDRTS